MLRWIKDPKRRSVKRKLVHCQIVLVSASTAVDFDTHVDVHDALWFGTKHGVLEGGGLNVICLRATLTHSGVQAWRTSSCTGGCLYMSFLTLSAKLPVTMHRKGS